MAEADEHRREVGQAVGEGCDAGLSIIWPNPDGSKRPEGAWKEYQERPQTKDELREGFKARDRDGLMVVCGKVSGGLECLDFETSEIYATFQAAMSLAGEEDLLDRIETGYQERCPRGGYHLPYRCEVVGGNTKLAFDENLETLIETRGEGGCFMAAPTRFNGSAWTRMRGEFATIATVTLEERATLHRVARLLCRAPVVNDQPVYEPKNEPARADRPGDDFNRRGDWSFLIEAGWTLAGQMGPQEYWRRPGKDWTVHRGHSAVLHRDSDLFVPFSSSTPFPQTQVGYSKYRSLTYVRFNGDFSAASSWLRKEGYGKEREKPSEPAPEQSEAEPGAAAPPALIFRTAVEIGEAVPEEVPWLCRPFFALGAITEIDGKAKKGGKTTFVLAAVRAVIDGSEFLDEAVIRTPVVFLSEQNDTTLRESLDRAGLLNHPELHIAQWALNKHLTWDQSVASARLQCQEFGAQMLVVDTFPQWAGIRGESENQSGPMLRAMEPLQVAAQKDGLAVVVLRHDRKAGGDVGESARGSSAIGGTVDVIIQIQRIGGRQQSLGALSRFDETPESVTVLLRDDGTYKLLGESDEVRFGELEGDVLEILAGGEEPPTLAEIVLLKGGTDRQTMSRVLKRLMAKGRVMRVGEGKKGSPYRWKLWSDA